MPSAEVIASVLALFGTVSAGVLGVYGVRISSRAQSQQAEAGRNVELIDRWRDYARTAEDYAKSVEERLSDRLDGQDAVIIELRARFDSVEEKARALRDYARVLRDHINNGFGPPPPPWPTDL